MVCASQPRLAQTESYQTKRIGDSQVHINPMPTIHKPEEIASASQGDHAAEEKQGEFYNYTPPSGRAVRRMDGLWLKYNHPGQNPDADALEPRSQTERVWAVLCKHRGAQVPQFDLQHPEGTGIGKGWIALLNTRIHELRWRYGFQIENRTERLGADVKTWYWPVIGSDGLPSKDHPVRLKDAATKPRNFGTSPKPPTSAAPTETRRQPEQDSLFNMGNPIRSAIGL